MLELKRNKFITDRVRQYLKESPQLSGSSDIGARGAIVEPSIIQTDFPGGVNGLGTDSNYRFPNRDRSGKNFLYNSPFPAPEFSFGQIIDDIKLIPASRSEREVLKKAGMSIYGIHESQTYIMKDKDSDDILGAITLQLEDNEIDHLEQRYQAAMDPTIPEDQDFADRPKSYVVRYFDVDPRGRNFKKCITRVTTFPNGISLQKKYVKVVRENVIT